MGDVRARRAAPVEEPRRPPVSPGRKDTVLILQRCLAVIYFLAGIMKPFPDFIAKGVPDNVPAVLKQAARNNAGTLLEGASLWLAEHPWFVIVVVATAMVGLGIVYWQDQELVRIAAAGNIVMLICIMVFLYRMTPQLVPVDTALVVVAVFIYGRQNRKMRRESQPERRLADAA